MFLTLYIWCYCDGKMFQWTENNTEPANNLIPHLDYILNKGELAKDHLTLFCGNRTERKGNGVKRNLSSTPLNQNSLVKDDNELQGSQWEEDAAWKTGKRYVVSLCGFVLRYGSWSGHHWSNGIQADSQTLCTPLGSKLPTKPAGSSSEENEVGIESCRRSPSVPTLRIAPAAGQGAAGTIFSTSDWTY